MTSKKAGASTKSPVAQRRARTKVVASHNHQPTETTPVESAIGLASPMQRIRKPKEKTVRARTALHRMRLANDPTVGLVTQRDFRLADGVIDGSTFYVVASEAVMKVLDGVFPADGDTNAVSVLDPVEVLELHNAEIADLHGSLEYKTARAKRLRAELDQAQANLAEAELSHTRNLDRAGERHRVEVGLLNTKIRGLNDEAASMGKCIDAGDLRIAELEGSVKQALNTVKYFEETVDTLETNLSVVRNHRPGFWARLRAVFLVPKAI